MDIVEARPGAHRGIKAVLLAALIAALVLASGSAPAWAASAPGAPTARAVPGNGFVLAAWKAPASNGAAITRYQVGSRTYSATTRKWSAWKLVLLGSTARSMKVSARNGTLVQIKVRASNRLGTGTWSATAQARAGTPTAPPTTTATRGDARATVSWGLPSSNGSAISGYTVQYRSSVSGRWTAWTARTVKASPRNLAVTGLVNGRSYQFRVAAKNRWGLGPYGVVATAVPGDTTPPGAVSGLAVGTRTASSIALSWTNPGDADLAVVVVRMAAGATPPTSSTGTVVQSSLATSATATDLGAATQYSFAVFARDAAGNLGPAATLTTTTMAAAGLQAVSTTAAGTFTGEQSYTSVWSPDGTKVALYTRASLDPVKDPDLMAPIYDVYIKDLATGAVTLVSHRPDGMSGNGESGGPVWSPDGTKIAFYSSATNLLATAQSNSGIYVYDLASGAVNRVDRGWDGSEPNYYASGPPTWSPDGNWIAYSSAAYNILPGGGWWTPAQVYAAHPDGTGTILVSRNMVDGSYGDGGSSVPVYAPTLPLRLLYVTSASNIVGASGGASKLVVTYQEPFASVRVDETLLAGGNNGVEGYTWSPDGSRVAFTSYSSNLATNDTNGASDVFVAVPGDRDPVRLSQSSPTVGGDGWSERPAWAGNGVVVFESTSSNLGGDGTPGRSKLYAATLATGGLALVSTSSDGASANASSYLAAANGDGTLLGFISSATNLVAGDTSVQDVFVKDLASGAVVRASQSAAGVGGNDTSGTNYAPMSWSPVADELLFTSYATNLVPITDYPSSWDSFLWKA